MVKSPLWLAGGLAGNRWAALEKLLHGRRFRRAYRARNHCLGVLCSRWALEITGWAGSEATWRSNSLLELAVFCVIAFEINALAFFLHIALDITARACSAATGHSKAWPGRSSKPWSGRNPCSSKCFSIRPRFSFCFEIPFEIALLRNLDCLELGFARLHRHHKVPYANLV